MKTLLIELSEVVVLGVLLALVANQVSPRGLKLDRDYFKESLPQIRAMPVATASVESSTATNSPPSPSEPGPRDGVIEVTAEATMSWFRDDRYRDGGLIFVDARKASAYEEGHIPGAYRFDRFYPEEDLPQVMLAGASADPVVVYCTGGTCEDSHYAARQLIEAGIDRARLRIYTAGITDWMSRQWPVERGVRGSGLVSNPLP